MCQGLTSSAPPDVMTWFAGNRARFFIDKGQIMDISDVYKSEGWDKSYPKGFQALSTVDGKQYFVPTSYYWWAVYYNKKVFEKYGLEPPKTWDEFMKVNETLKKNGMEVTLLTPKEIEAFKAKTKGVYEKWTKEIGADLVHTAEKAVAGAK